MRKHSRQDSELHNTMILNLYKSLDSEFFTILGIYSWVQSGLLTVNIMDLPFGYALMLKYLIDYNEAQRVMLF